MHLARWLSSRSDEQITTAVAVGFIVVLVLAMAGLYFGSYSLRP
jgi:hypothetical protein